MDEFMQDIATLLRVFQLSEGAWSARTYSVYTGSRISRDRAVTLMERLTDDGLIEPIGDSRLLYRLTKFGREYKGEWGA